MKTRRWYVTNHHYISYEDWIPTTSYEPLYLVLVKLLQSYICFLYLDLLVIWSRCVRWRFSVYHFVVSFINLPNISSLLSPFFHLKLSRFVFIKDTFLLLFNPNNCFSSCLPGVVYINEIHCRTTIQKKLISLCS